VRQRFAPGAPLNEREQVTAAERLLAEAERIAQTCMISPEYVAGFFDGEGSVFLQSHGSLEVRISQTDRRPLDAIKERFGGVVTPMAARGTSAPYHQWRIMRWEEGEFFLREIQPWLIVKSEKVKLVLRYIETCRSEGHRFARGHHLPKHLFPLREQLAVDLNALTTKGRRRSPGRKWRT
jgi:hypothetical protein